MNIIVLSYYYLPDYSGGAKQWSGVMERMKEDHDINFTVIAARTNQSYPKAEVINGISVKRVELSDTNRLFSYWYNASREIWKKRSSIDLVHANGLKMEHGFPLWVANILNIPTVGRLSIANSDINFSSQGRLLGKIHKWCLERIDRYVAISSALQKEIVEVGLPGERCVVLFNGVNTEIYRTISVRQKMLTRAKLDLKDETIVLFVGVMDKRKGVDVLIPAFRRVVNARKNVRLVMLGPANREDSGGEYIVYMKRKLVELDISEKVDIRDYTEDIVQYYQTADLLVLPSRKEGMPNVVLEAMACCLPIVGTRISGTEDLVTEGESGLLVAVEDEVALADALIELVDNPKRRLKMGKEAMETIKKKHDMRAVSKSYFNLYKQLISHIQR